MASYTAYRNLNKPGCFSVRQNGKVIAHPKALIMLDCEIHVGEKGRLRVLRDRRKNVHAWIRSKQFKEIGKLTDFAEYEELYYDPYFTQHFFSLRTGEIVHRADEIILANNRCYISTSKLDRLL